ncbi:MAG: lactonase family protein [Terracidiphilus sp.]|jgi:6-phosphogluconolactonase
MKNMNRRDFLISASAATLAAGALPAFAATQSQQVFVASNGTEGILAFDWNPATAELTAAGGAAQIANIDWLALSPNSEFICVASEVDSFNGKPTGEVASFAIASGKLSPLSAENSAGTGTCHVALDHTGSVLLAADYAGGSAASFLVTNGRLSSLVWSEHYNGAGPNAERQASAHAHFASFSPDNRYAYINDLGLDCIHIYTLDVATAVLTPAGTYHGQPGSGCRTLHFHPNGVTAYCVNELNSTVDVLKWSSADGSLTLVTRINLLPAGYHGLTRGCDAVITKDGSFVYFANRDDNFLYSFHANPKTGALTPMVRSSCGGKTPRNFVLDPTESWMLVANQDSNNISIFARNTETGLLAAKGKTISVAAPMCILFV